MLYRPFKTKLLFFIALTGCLMTVSNIALSQSDEVANGFYLVFYETSDENVSYVLDLIEEDEELLFDLVDELNDYLDMPLPVPIVFTDCGTNNAFYDPTEVQITICYEMILNTYQLFASNGMEGDELVIAVANDVFTTLYHEVGHALIDILELPITGSEEDAADQFAVVSLLVFEELGHQALIHNALYWALNAELSETNIQNMPFWDNHALNSQRFYNILCLAYGSDIENLSFLVEEGILPEERAFRCENDFERVSYAWEVILEPYLRE